jgi:3-methyladenine DNA glycosylase AlkD
MPRLRALAKEILRDNPRAFLAECQREYHEEVLLEALVRAQLKPADYDDFVHLAEDFLDGITNWGVCDTFSMTLKVRPDRERFFQRLGIWLGHENPWHIRSALVVMLASYVDADHIGHILSRAEQLNHSHYYVQMGQAWLVADCYIKFPEITEPWLLRGDVLNEATVKMTLRKILDSYRVPADKKAWLRGLLRPAKPAVLGKI